MHHKQSRKADKRQGEGTEHTQREGAGAHRLHPVDTTTATNGEPQRKPCNPQNQNIFHFCPFWSPKFPRKHQSTPKKNSLLPLFALIRCPFDLVECRRSPEAVANESLFDI